MRHSLTPIYRKHFPAERGLASCPRPQDSQRYPGLGQSHHALVSQPTLLEMVWPCLGPLPDLTEGLLGLYPDIALALEEVIAQHLLLGGRVEASGGWPGIKEQPHTDGGARTASQEREAWESDSAPDLWDHREPRGHRAKALPQRVTQMPRTGQGQV